MRQDALLNSFGRAYLSSHQVKDPMHWKKVLVVQDDGTIVEFHPRDVWMESENGFAPIQGLDGQTYRQQMANPHLTVKFEGLVGAAMTGEAAAIALGVKPAAPTAEEIAEAVGDKLRNDDTLHTQLALKTSSQVAHDIRYGKGFQEALASAMWHTELPSAAHVPGDYLRIGSDRIPARMLAGANEKADAIQCDFQQTISPENLQAAFERALEDQEAKRMATIDDTPENLPVTAPPKPESEFMSVFKDAGKIAAGATVLTIVSRGVHEMAAQAGLPKAALEHPVFIAIVKLAAPSVLRAVVARVPGVKNVKSVDQILRIAQVSAVASIAQDTIEAIFDNVAPMFKQINETADRVEQLSGDGIDIDVEGDE